jgi:polysaccharide biosynthesis/export protein
MKRAVLCGWLPALLLAGCSWFPGMGPSGAEVVAQANPGDTIAFDVVKIDDAVVKVVRSQREPPFHERFKKYIPPPEMKIEVGDLLSVIIWEAASNGLFGNSLAEWSVAPGVASRLLGSATSGIGALSTAGQSLATSSTDVLSQLLGGAPAQGLAPGGTQALTGGPGQDLSGLGAQGLAGAVGEGLGAAALAFSGLATLPSTLQGTVPGGAAGTLPPRAPATGGITPQNLQELLQHAVETGRPGTRIPDQQVGTDGAISIPYGGRIEAAGRTPAELQRTIEERLGPKALQPQALVVIRRSVANSVSVSGESVKGTRVPLSPGGDRLLQVIATAGGSNARVHDIFVQLSRGGVTATVPLATLVADPEQNIFAEPGDVITLVRRPQTFSAFGATGRNAAITFTSDRLSLAEALAKAGGLLDDLADPRAVFLFRYEPVSLVRALGQPIATRTPNGVSPIVYRLDLSDAKSYPLAREFPVRDKDIIFVANAELAHVYKAFATLSYVTGPIFTGLLTCQSTKC